MPRKTRQEERQRSAESAPGVLTPKQQLFVASYLANGGNGTQAAKAAGYAAGSASVQAARLLANARIRAAVDKGLQRTLGKLEVTRERVLLELARIAYLDPADLFDSKGNLRPLTEMPEDARRAIAGLDVSELFEGQGSERRTVGVLKKVKLAGKVEALQLLGKHLELFQDKIDLTTKGKALGHKDLILLALQRRAQKAGAK